MNKKYIIIGIIILVVAGGIYYFMTKNKNTASVSYDNTNYNVDTTVKTNKVEDAVNKALGGVTTVDALKGKLKKKK